MAGRNISRESLIRGATRLAVLERLALKSHACSAADACSAMLASAESAARCVTRAPNDGKPYHIRTTEAQRVKRSRKHAAVAAFYAADSIDAIIRAAEEKD